MKVGMPKPNSITLAGSELVRSWFEPDSVMEFGFEAASNQLRISSEPASVMEFGFKWMHNFPHHRSYVPSLYTWEQNNIISMSHVHSIYAI